MDAKGNVAMESEITRILSCDKDFYKILKVDKQGFSSLRLTKHYHGAALLVHPDKAREAGPRGKEATQLLNDAYATLKDSDKKAEYDRKREAESRRREDFAEAPQQEQPESEEEEYRPQGYWRFEFVPQRHRGQEKWSSGCVAVVSVLIGIGAIYIAFAFVLYQKDVQKPASRPRTDFYAGPADEDTSVAFKLGPTKAYSYRLESQTLSAGYFVRPSKIPKGSEKTNVETEVERLYLDRLEKKCNDEKRVTQKVDINNAQYFHCKKWLRAQKRLAATSSG